MSGEQLAAEKRRALLLEKKEARPVLGSGYIYKNLPQEGSLDNPKLEFSPDQQYLLTGAALQGFYQTSENISAWSLGESDYTIEAQLIRRGLVPRPITDQVKLEWEIRGPGNEAQTSAQATDPAESGTGGSVEAAGDSGLAKADSPRKGEMQPAKNSQFFTAVIPGTALEHEGVFNPYPLVTIRALDEQGKVLAESASVLGISPGFSCAYCHEDAERTILELHDKRMGTSLAQSVQPAQSKAGATGESGGAGDRLECKSCHLGASYSEGKYQDGGIMSLSAAVHGWHAPYLSDKEGKLGQEACLSCHIGLGRSAEEQGAVKPMFMRDLHQQRGLSCVSCHGSMEEHALALLAAEKLAGQAQAAESIERLELPAELTEEVKPRLAWVQEPDCTGCHNFRQKPRLDTASAFNKWTSPAAGSASTVQSAVNTDPGQEDLFSRRNDRSGRLRCLTCHGAPHAVYAARNPVAQERDNLPPLQYQHNPRVLGVEGNCAACHTLTMKVPMLHHQIAERSVTEIQVPPGAERSLPQVRFPHAAHVYFDCMTCHHNGHVDGQSLACVSSGCHDQPDAESAGPDQSYRYFRNAFHGDENSCYGCHDSRQRKFLSAGPTDCQGCHRAPAKMWEQAKQ